MYEKEKQALLDAALKLKEYRLISLSGGNASVRLENGRFLVTPSGMLYEAMTYDDIVVVDHTGAVVEGKRKPSSDLAALLYLFEKRPWVNAILHTHQPYATAIGMVRNRLPACMVTLIDAARADINVAPFTPSSALGMGELAAEYAGDALSVILGHHGVIAFGESIEEALFSAVYLEEGAKTYLFASLMGPVPELDPALVAQELAGWQNYGQTNC